MLDLNQKLWEKCAEVHGHECGGLTIGYKAALYAMERLNLQRAEDGCVADSEVLACVAENNACSVDGIRVALGCTEEKGNLVFHLTGQQVYTVFNRKTRETVRITLKLRPEGLAREQMLAYYQGMEPEEMFDCQPVNFSLPESARDNREYVCVSCGERGGANWFRFVDGKPLCMDCFAEYQEQN